MLLPTLATVAIALTAAPPSSPIAAPPPAAAVVSPEADVGFAAPARTDDLGSTRAGADTAYAAVTDQTLSAVNSGNAITAASVTTGAIGFGAGALSGFNGVGNFVMNTGNNNNLQGAITVNVLITPP